MDDNDGDYAGLTPQHEERLRALAASAGLLPAYRETIERTIAELDMLKANRAYRSAWEALRGITLRPPHRFDRFQQFRPVCWPASANRAPPSPAPVTAAPGLRKPGAAA